MFHLVLFLWFIKCLVSTSLKVWVLEDFLRYSFWVSFSLWLQILDIWLNLSDHGALLLLTLDLYEKNSWDTMITSVCTFLSLSINGISSYIVGLNQICCMLLLGSCSIMLISGPEQGIVGLNALIFVSYSISPKQLCAGFEGNLLFT